MSKKHFIALAQALANERPIRVRGVPMPAEYVQWLSDVCAVARVCGEMSPRFDHPRFLKACETWAEVEAKRA